MGAAASGDDIVRCSAICKEACPSAQSASSSASELAKRQQAYEERRKQVAAARGRCQTSQGALVAADGKRTGCVGAFSRLQSNATRYLGGELTLNEVLSGRAHNDQEVVAEDELDVDPALRARLAQIKHDPDNDLQRGAARGDLQKVRRAIGMRADPALKNIRGVTPLMLCSSSSGKEALEVLKELLEKKGDLNARDGNGWTAIHHACRNGKIEAARFLMQLSSDPGTKAHDDKTTLMLAAMEGKLDVVSELLKARQVKAQVPDRDALGATALHYSSKEGSSSITKCLLEHSAKVSSKDIDSRTPMMRHCRGSVFRVRLLGVQSPT